MKVKALLVKSSWFRVQMYFQGYIKVENVVLKDWRKTSTNLNIAKEAAAFC